MRIEIIRRKIRCGFFKILNVCFFIFVAILPNSCSPPAPNEQKGMNLGVRYEIRSRRPIRIKDAQMIEAAGQWGENITKQINTDLAQLFKDKKNQNTDCQQIFDTLAGQMKANLQVEAFVYNVLDIAKNTLPSSQITSTEAKILQAYSDAFSQKATLQANVQKSKENNEIFIYSCPVKIDTLICKKCLGCSSNLNHSVYIVRMPQSQIINFILDSKK